MALATIDPAVSAPKHGVVLTPIGSYTTGVFDQGGAEIVAHDKENQRVYVINAQAASVDVLDISLPTSPTKVHTIDVTPFGAVANSVAVHQGAVAVAVENVNRQLPGKVVFFDENFTVLASVDVGAVPDMVVFTPDGKSLLVANEGEPSTNYATDPEGSVSVVDLADGIDGVTQAHVRTAGFSAFNGGPPPGVRIFGLNNPTVAQDLEPEYITVSHDSRTAWVTLQENNALAVIDIPSAQVTSIHALGEKNHNLPGNGLDPSDHVTSGGAVIGPWPVRGLYMPDGIASFTHHGDTFLVLANEGDAREYTGLVEARRVSGVALDPTAFPNAAALKTNAQLGRLNVSSVSGDVDKDGDFDILYAFGARSFSIRRPDGTLVFDSGDQLEQITKASLPLNFNASHTNNSLDNRSDDKGPEPEGVVVGKAFGLTLAFIGLERIGGVVTFDVTNPHEPRFLHYVNFRDFTKDPATQTLLAGDLGPEGLVFINEEDSPNGKPLLVVGNEVSGSTTVLEISRQKK